MRMWILSASLALLLSGCQQSTNQPEQASKAGSSTAQTQAFSQPSNRGVDQMTAASDPAPKVSTYTEAVEDIVTLPTIEVRGDLEQINDEGASINSD